MSNGAKFAIREAVWFVEGLLPVLRGRCERMKVVGSVRRRKALVGDVEILYIPRIEFRDEPGGLFGDVIEVNLVDEMLEDMLRLGVIRKRKDIRGQTAWGAKNKLAEIPTGIEERPYLALDLFSATPETWYNQLVCRTGPAALNQLFAGRAQRLGYRWTPYGPGFVDGDGNVRPVESERDLFAFLGMPYLEPWEREP